MTDKLDLKEQTTILKLAREILHHYIEHGSDDFSQIISDCEITEKLKEKRGVFVSLHKQGDLRGCIGHIEGVYPLFEGVIENVINSSSRDPRFPKVSADELNEIKIEISALTPIKKLNSLDDIIIGETGLILTNGTNKGVFLPQVPVEWNWDKTAYLENLGEKAALGPNGYLDPKSILECFTAQVLKE